MINLSDYKQLYLSTSLEYLQDLKTRIKQLTIDQADLNAISEIHRLTHSIKSQSLVMGYLQIASLCSVLENIFYEVKEKRLTISENLLNLVSKSLNNLEESLMRIDKENKEIDLLANVRGLEKLTGVKSSIKI